MLESWILPLAIAAVFAPLLESLLPRVQRRRFVCPWASSEVAVEFVERTAFGEVTPPDVRSCSAIIDPGIPACGKRCPEGLGAGSWADLPPSPS